MGRSDLITYTRCSGLFSFEPAHMVRPKSAAGDPKTSVPPSLQALILSAPAYQPGVDYYFPLA